MRGLMTLGNSQPTPALHAAATSATPAPTRNQRAFRFNGAEWQAVVSLRNLVYTDAPDASVYDEISVIRSPKLVAGGVTVRF